MGLLTSVLGLLLCILPITERHAIWQSTIGIGIMFLGLIQFFFKATRDEHQIKQREDIEKMYERENFKLHSQIGRAHV